MNSQVLDDIFGGVGNGVLDLFVSERSDWKGSKARRLNVGLGTMDFDAIFAGALKSIGLEPVDTSGHYDGEKYEANWQQFKSKLPQFPMLTTYQDMYQDYIHDPNQIASLRKECQTLQEQIGLAGDADLALRKLIYGCEEASNVNGYLIFVCD